MGESMELKVAVSIYFSSSSIAVLLLGRERRREKWGGYFFFQIPYQDGEQMILEAIDGLIYFFRCIERNTLCV